MRVTDLFWAALRDVVVGIRPGADRPVRKIKIQLEQAFAKKKKERERELHVLQSSANRFVDAEKQQRKRRLRRLISTKEHSEKVISRVEQQLEEKYSLQTVTRAEREKAEVIFEKWYKALARPPYRLEHRSIVDNLRFKLEPLPNSGGGVASMTPTIDTENMGPRTRRLVSILAAVAGIVVIPLDVIYALPGFEVLLNNDFFARIAALILGMMLLFFGATLAFLISRAYSHYLNEDGTLAGRYRILPSVLLFVVAGLAISTVYGATTVRSIVPEANALIAEQRTIETQLSVLRARASGSMSLQQRQEEVERLLSEASSLEARLAEVRRVQLPRPTADALIAFCFYSFAVLSVMISRLGNHDPVFEYELAATAYGTSLAAEIRVANGIQIGRAQAEALQAELDVNIEDQKQDLASDVELDEVRQAKIEEKKLEIAALEADEVSRVRSDALRYARYFRFLTRNSEVLREWEELFEGPELEVDAMPGARSAA